MNILTVKNFKAISLGVVGTTVVGLGLGSTPAEAVSIFTSESDFLSNVQSGSYQETFDSLSEGFVSSPQFFQEVRSATLQVLLLVIYLLRVQAQILRIVSFLQ